MHDYPFLQGVGNDLDIKASPKTPFVITEIRSPAGHPL